MTGTRAIVIGHRGASGYRPEHTAAAYELAFVQGADAVEPDLVLSGDGVLVLRHENEISTTTDIAEHPEFAARRTVRSVDGREVEGWFTEDFSWEELRTLRARERRPGIRPGSAAFDDRYGLLSFAELLRLVERVSAERGRRLGVVAELKHPSHFAARGLSLVDAYRDELARQGWAGRDRRLVTECFEATALRELAAEADGGRLVYLMEAEGTPPDLRAAGMPDHDRDDHDELTDARLHGLRREFDGISLEKSLVLDDDRFGDVVPRAHAAGLLVFCWTLRPERRYLEPRYRGPGTDSGPDRGPGCGPGDGDDRGEWGDWGAEWRRLFATGVDGVFADHPDLALSVRDETTPPAR
ncbi:MAG TPA: glycerophosphodiester phosphodiesterase family protein [Gryllotalpicola sp.]